MTRGRQGSLVAEVLTLVKASQQHQCIKNKLTDWCRFNQLSDKYNLQTARLPGNMKLETFCAACLSAPR